MYLNCKTYFSYRYGTYKTQELVEKAAELGISSLALTNINSTTDMWDFVDFCRAKYIKPIAGAEICNDHKFCYILLAKNDKGLHDINRFISEHLQASKLFPGRPKLSHDIFIIYPLGAFQPDELGLQEFIGVKPTEINKLFTLNIKRYPKKFVIRQPVTFQNKKNHNIHRLLRAIDKNTLLSKLSSDDVAGPEEIFMSRKELIDKFVDYPFIIRQTMQLMDNCFLEMEMTMDKNKKSFTESLKDDQILLEKLALEGLAYRYGEDNQEARDRVFKELKVINDENFNAYFLIVWDIIREASARGFYYVGRGSGANSIVAYCLRITDVDPVKLDLYFERFLNKYRVSPPDFDMDFSWKDRDEITSYIFNRYGNDHVALLGMQTTFQRRATVRELGKVFGLPKSEIDVLANKRDLSTGEDQIQDLIIKYSKLMEAFPNHLSIHPGGILISEKPIYAYTALELPPKGLSTAQTDMFMAEKVGLTKFDILSQRGLGHIKDAIRLVKENQGIDIDIHQVEKFMQDERVAAQIRKADTIGCFYIESPAMRQLLLKLRCDDYLTLVAASSIIRPGVSQSGMMKQYIQRFHDPGKIEYLHPKMEELLKETFGIMVYQEDVIKVAHHFAGLDMAEADILRRAMSGKYRGREEMTRIENKFFDNCKERGYPESISYEVWRQIASFSGYSFSKAHSASFAVESYQSLYLKTYFPTEFMVAVINNFGGFYRTEFYFHELKKTGATVHPPCINQSQYSTSISGKEVFTGFVHIQNLEDGVMRRILSEREENGLYLSLEDFILRTQIGVEQINILIRIDALRFTGIQKKALLWKANFFQKRQKAQPVTTTLFNEPIVDFVLPEFPKHVLQDAMDEIEILGFTLQDKFSLVDDTLEGVTLSSEFRAHLGKEVVVLGQLVTTKDVRTIKRDYMAFGTFLDPVGDWLDTVHFPDTLAVYPFQGNGFYRMKGKVVEEFGVYSVEVYEMNKVGLKQI